MRTASYVRAMLALAAALVLGGTLLAAPATSVTPTRVAAVQVSAKAPGCMPYKCWAAISFNTETLRSGWTQNKQWGSKKKAVQSAFAHCKNRPVNEGHRDACKSPEGRKAYNQGGCVAVAWRVKDGNLVEWAVGKSLGPIVAQRKARKAVRGEGTVDSGYACPPRRGR
ncbi:hypothetical protein [Nocardioides silvaticus]|nr:hypothetical protein [Nocardioides silvaticus]